MIGRTAFVASLLAGAIVLVASQANASVDVRAPAGKEAAAAEASSATEKPACRVVKVVYAGHGEAARAPCRPA